MATLLARGRDVTRSDIQSLWQTWKKPAKTQDVMKLPSVKILGVVVKSRV